jgi:hypothetical protein
MDFCSARKQRKWTTSMIASERACGARLGSIQDIALAPTLADIDRFTARRFGTFDLPCPWCGPHCHSPTNRRRKVLRVWRLDPAFATWHCARCDERGYARDASTARSPLHNAAIARAKAEAAEHERASVATQLRKAKWLWTTALPITGTIAERYLRDCRGYRGPLPPTLRFLPARGEHHPAMIAAFGLTTEPVPSRLAIADADIVGVHTTRLNPHGSGKADIEKPKIMIGRSTGSPIVIGPLNDALGLAITEGIEDALSAYQSTGLGAWAAGSGSRMSTLVDAVPNYIEVVTIYAHPDDTGQRGAHALAKGLDRRGIEVFIEGIDYHDAAA